ncbi:MAG: toast rack family protein [Bacteroidales bacterium]|nr:toast rack family protein [Bacteroidales bacterium]
MEELETGKTKKSVIKHVIQQKAEGAQSVQVDINVGACRLNISNGSKQLFTGGFAYTHEDWKPEYSYSVHNEKGFLSIKQPEIDDVNFNDDDKYVWNLKFGEQVPLEFDINLGAGLTEIKLGSLPLKSFNMTMGVGKTTLDLRGEWKNGAEIHLEGGIGLLQIYLPENIGVKIDILKALTDIDTQNLKQIDKNTYVNKYYKKSNATISIYLKTGIGKIEIK